MCEKMKKILKVKIYYQGKKEINYRKNKFKYIYLRTTLH